MNAPDAHSISIDSERFQIGANAHHNRLLVCTRLKCPLKGKGRGDKSGPYQSLLSLVCTFRELDALYPYLNEHVSVSEVAANEAKWHKYCHIKFGYDRHECC